MPETVGERVRRVRLERGLSQRDLGEPGVTYAYISRIEAGTRTPSVKALRKIAAKLDVDPFWLETGEQPFEAVLRERCWSLVEIAHVWRSRAIAAYVRIEALEREGKTTPDPSTLADTLIDEVRRLTRAVAFHDRQEAAHAKR